jgi:hypothetical protein
MSPGCRGIACRRFGKNKALNLGYRYLEGDYDNSPTYALDMNQH